jgi:signal transduction histidine kinase
MPIIVHDEIIGTLGLDSVVRRTFQPHEISLVRNVAASVGQALSNARLIEQLQTELADNRRAELELKQAKEAAEAANRAKSAFLAQMSHELRTPLNAVIGFSEVIATQHLGPISQSYRDYGGQINTAGQHLLGIIEDILEMSRIEAGRITLAPEPISLKSTVRSVLSMTAHQVDARAVDLSVDIDEDADRFEADPQRLKQILINLLSNALKYTNLGGHVRLTARAAGEDIEIRVEDDGIGIAPADLNLIFEPFAFSGASTTRARGGIGLGLSITKTLVDLHHGHLEIESELGQGTTVSVRLPKARKAHNTPSAVEQDLQPAAAKAARARSAK